MQKLVKSVFLFFAAVVAVSLFVLAGAIWVEGIPAAFREEDEGQFVLAAFVGLFGAFVACVGVGVLWAIADELKDNKKKSSDQ